MTRMPVTGCTRPAQDQTEQNASMDEEGAHVYSYRAEELPPLPWLTVQEGKSAFCSHADSERLSVLSPTA